jgi:hypothetical protein
VIKKGSGKSGSNLSRLIGVNNGGFMHVALALQTVFDEGRLLLSNDFIASPDTDFMDHIDFTPYVFNSLNVVVYTLFNVNGKMHLYPALGLRHVNQLNASLLWLAKFYFGMMVLTPTLKTKLVLTVKHELQKSSILKNKPLSFIRAATLFCIAYTYYRCRQVLTGKGGVRLRD